MGTVAEVPMKQIIELMSGWRLALGLANFETKRSQPGRRSLDCQGINAAAARVQVGETWKHDLRTWQLFQYPLIHDADAGTHPRRSFLAEGKTLGLRGHFNERSRDELEHLWCYVWGWRVSCDLSFLSQWSWHWP
ncbi:MAG: hypothetical protein ACTHKT_04340 [Solirubrobacterales bacterium]